MAEKLRESEMEKATLQAQLDKANREEGESSDAVEELKAQLAAAQ